MQARRARTIHFDAEVRRVQGQLFRIALSVTGSEADAWDAVQETLLKAYTHLEQYRGEAAFSTWVIRILYRTCFDELRRRSRRPLPWSLRVPGADGGRADSRLPGVSVTPGAPSRRRGGPSAPALSWPGAMVGQAPDPAELAEQRDLQLRVRRAVAQLPPPFRTVVDMQLRGMSYEEICAALDLPPGTVKSRLHRARLLLRAALAPVAVSPRPAG